MVLPNTLIPYSDETIYSFIVRLALENGFSDVDQFYRMTISPSHTSAFRGYGNTYSEDSSGVFEDISKLITVLGNDHPIAKDPEQFYRQHSLYPIYSMFCKNTDEKNEHIAQYVTGKKKATNAIGSLNASDRPMCFCKECIKEDSEKYGHRLIHRVHQIPGVNVCVYHKEPLLFTENLTNDNITDSIPAEKHNTLADPSLAYQYALMCKNLLENPIETTARDIEKAISKTMDSLPPMLWYSYYKDNDLDQNPKIKTIAIEREKRNYLRHAAQDSYLLEMYQGYEKKEYSRGSGVEDPSSYFCSEYGQDINLVLVLIFILYRTADMVRKIISQKGIPTNEDKARIILNLLTDEYDIKTIECEAYNTSLYLTHKKCGKSLCTTLRRFFMNGERCPYCQNEQIDDLDEHLRSETNGKVRFLNGIATVRGTKNIKMDKKQVLQELSRPFLSPVFELTKKDRIDAHCQHRAAQLFVQDRTDIADKLNPDSNMGAIRSFLRKTYPKEHPKTISALAENYSRYLIGTGFNII